MKNIIAIALIVGGLLLGYQGVTTVTHNSTEVKLLGIKVDASNETGKEKGYIYIGGGVLLVLLGGYLLKNNK
ncbi:MAG: hypothetical protein ABI844_05050 [Saprospiraceae bacterium]